jgi:1,2-dihydroxy-3-keto-5-methylthiopentene dioxygenase
MSLLAVYADTEPETPLASWTAAADIRRELAAIGVRFERVDAAVDLPEGAGQDEILSAYKNVVDKERVAHGYTTVDVVRIRPDAPNVDEARRKFLSEHTHTEDEARVFVEGSGAFYLHVGGRVYRIVCTRGDLISVPEGTRHWFDMGPRPLLAAIRFFVRPDGWVGHFTGDRIAERFPAYDACPV